MTDWVIGVDVGGTFTDLSDSTAITYSLFLLLLFLALFLRKIRDLQQRFATDAAYLLFDQR
jgi:hypothetical protein